MSRQVFTPAMLASAMKHYEERDTWTRLHVTMAGRPTRSVVVFESSKKDAEGRPLVYQTMDTFCSCPGFEYHGGVCSHWLAVRMDTEQARRRATRRPRQSTQIVAPHLELTDAF